MKWGIKTKLLTAFVLVILVPVLITGASLSLVGRRLEQTLDPEAFGALEQVSDAIAGEVAAWLEAPDPAANTGVHAQPPGDGAAEATTTGLGRDQLAKRLQPLLQEYKLHLQVLDPKGRLVFEASGVDEPHSGSTAAPSSSESVSRPAPGSLGVNLLRYTSPVIVGGEQAGTVVIRADPSTSLVPLGAVNETIAAVLLSMGLGFLSLIVLIAGFTWYLSRTILRPLQALGEATQRIAEGDLDFHLNPQGKDEFGRLSQAFETMRRRLKASLEEQARIENARKEMVANIAHDLRTPVSSIRGYVAGLEDGIARDEAMVERYLRVIRDKTEQLSRLISDLSQSAELEAHGFELRREKADSRDVLESILQSERLSATGGETRFYVEEPLPSVPVWVDRHRIEQVLENLIQNARRYGRPNGAITVRAEAADERLVVSVEDDGPGISPEDMPHIFDPFYRGEKSRSRDFGGTGQGLAICKGIVEAHGGRIWAESRPGQGSIFSFSLPIVRE